MTFLKTTEFTILFVKFLQNLKFKHYQQSKNKNCSNTVNFHKKLKKKKM